MNRFVEFEVPGGAPTVGGILLACALLAFFGFKRLDGLPRSRKAFLWTLRTLSAAGVALLSIQPSCVTEDTTEDVSPIAIAVDVSRSMRIGAPARTRMDRVRALIKRWREEKRLDNVSIWSFGKELRPRRFEDPIESWEGIEDDTNMAEAFRGLASEAVTVVVVSDGRDHGSGAIQEAQALGLRVHTIWVGEGERLEDDGIAALNYDRVGFLRRPIRIRPLIRSYGRSAHVVNLSLFENDELIKQLRVDVPEEGEVQPQFEVTPTKVGRLLYRIELDPMGPDQVPENNWQSLIVRVVRDELRALLVAGRPSWDARFLRSWLKREPTVDLITFFILRDEGDDPMAASHELALIPFPTDELFREHLGSFDLLIFQNFDFVPFEMDAYIPQIREYLERGGAIAVIGGPLAFSSGLSPDFASLLPVEILGGTASPKESILFDAFRPRLSAEGLYHPIVALHADPSANKIAWKRVPPFHGLNRVLRLRPWGHLLLGHPSVLGEDGKPLPVLVVGERGEGRVLVLLTDSTWRWAFQPAEEDEGEGLAYERFWDAAVRWLIRDPSFEPSRITTDQERYGPGAQMHVEVLLRHQTYRPIAGQGFRLRLMNSKGAQAWSLEARTDSQGQARIECPAPREAGGYRLIAEDEAGNAKASEVFVVEEGGQELADPRPDPELMRELAAKTGGVFQKIEEAGSLKDFVALARPLRRITRSKPFASPAFVVPLLLLLGLEWILRRRWLGKA
ncbi:MAG: MG2 domain-containing protein [Sandaracinaceae bacterium]|nr:MG2 domain-containing protein [Sandaracinaceae bacterium]